MNGVWRYTERGRRREVSRTWGKYLFGDSSEFPIPHFSLVSLCVCMCARWGGELKQIWYPKHGRIWNVHIY
jgi:hypothetical protein